MPWRNISSKHPKVTKVIFPGLMTGETKRRADAYLKGGYGGLVGFELKGGRDAGRKFIDSLKMFYHVANIGDARSLAIHPASTTHSQLTPEEQAKTGVTDGYVRLSVGIEHIDDILADLDQASRARVAAHKVVMDASLSLFHIRSDWRRGKKEGANASRAQSCP